MLNVSGSPRYIVEWLEVIRFGAEEDAVQVGYVREPCSTLGEVRAELRSQWKNAYLTGFCILVRNEAGSYDFMKGDGWKDPAMAEFIEKAKDEPLVFPELYAIPESALIPYEVQPGPCEEKSPKHEDPSD
jgi:hypothetical protein